MVRIVEQAESLADHMRIDVVSRNEISVSIDGTGIAYSQRPVDYGASKRAPHAARISI